MSAFTAKSRFAKDRSGPAPDASRAYAFQCDECGAYDGRACFAKNGSLRKTPHAARVAQAAKPVVPCTCTHSVVRQGCFCAASVQ